jgi:lipoprotein-anchoring transpeptidase ErfK/SrfK
MCNFNARSIRAVERVWLHMLLVAILPTICASPSVASVLISVDKSTQQMSVSVDGSPRYHFTVSTGRTGYGTPSGTYHPQRMERTWFSKEYYNSPMPHSIFFRGGYAIHGSYEINRLGGPASHGCIRLHPSDAATLYALVQSEGKAATTIVVSGSNPTSARSPALSVRPSAEPSYRYDWRYPTYQQPQYRTPQRGSYQYYYPF